MQRRTIKHLIAILYFGGVCFLKVSAIAIRRIAAWFASTSDGGSRTPTDVDCSDVSAI